MTGSGQTTTDADELGLGVTLGLGLADGLADGLELALGDGLADVDSLADGLALLLGSGDDTVADGDAEFETCGEGSVVVVGSSVAVRAVIVSDVDAFGDGSSAVSMVGVGDALASSRVESSLTDEEADTLGESEAEGELLDDGEVLGDGEADGDDSGDALGEIEVDGETDGDALTASVGSQRAGTCDGITHGSGSLEVASSFNVTSASASSLWEIGDDSWPWSTAFAGSVDAANEDTTTASEASHATNERRIRTFHLFAFVAAIGVAEGRPAG